MANHPLFSELYIRYVASFNALADKLDEVGVDVAELLKVVEAVEDIEG